VGAVFTVFSRKLKVVDYADEFTRSKFVSKQKYIDIFIRTFAMIKPDALNNIGHII
jgi:nucleoside-diphosphate kinase